MNIAMMLQIKSYKHSITLDFKKTEFSHFTSSTSGRKWDDQGSIYKHNGENIKTRYFRNICFPKHKVTQLSLTE